MALLRQLRVEAGLTVTEMGHRLEIPPSRVSAYELSGRRLDYLQLREYVTTLGLTIEEFVARAEKALTEP